MFCRRRWRRYYFHGKSGNRSVWFCASTRIPFLVKQFSRCRIFTLSSVISGNIRSQRFAAMVVVENDLSTKERVEMKFLSTASAVARYFSWSVTLSPCSLIDVFHRCYRYFCQPLVPRYRRAWLFVKWKFRDEPWKGSVKNWREITPSSNRICNKGMFERNDTGANYRTFSRGTPRIRCFIRASFHGKSAIAGSTASPRNSKRALWNSVKREFWNFNRDLIAEWSLDRVPLITPSHGPFIISGSSDGKRRDLVCQSRRTKAYTSRIPVGQGVCCFVE